MELVQAAGSAASTHGMCEGRWTGGFRFTLVHIDGFMGYSVLSMLSPAQCVTTLYKYLYNMFMTITDDCVQLYMYRQTPINIVPVLVQKTLLTGH